MISFNDQVNQLHAAYNEASAQECPLMPHFERCWVEMLSYGVTPDDVKLVVKGRLKKNLTKGYDFSISLNKLIDGDANQANFINELSQIKAGMRKPKHCPSKVAVLEQSGRSGEIEQGPARSLSELLAGMRKATA
jgi:hypothetical protein